MWIYNPVILILKYTYDFETALRITNLRSVLDETYICVCVCTHVSEESFHNICWFSMRTVTHKLWRSASSEQNRS